MFLLKKCRGAVHLKCSCTPLPWCSWKTAGERSCYVLYPTTAKVCVSHTMFSCWQYHGIHASGPQNWGEFKILYRRACYAIAVKWWLKLLVAVNVGIICSWSERAILQVIVILILRILEMEWWCWKLMSAVTKWTGLHVAFRILVSTGCSLWWKQLALQIERRRAWRMGGGDQVSARIREGSPGVEECTS